MASTDYNQRFEEARSKGWDITAMALGVGGIGIPAIIGAREYLRHSESTVKNDRKMNQGGGSVAGGSDKGSNDTIASDRYRNDLWQGMKNYEPGQSRAKAIVAKAKGTIDPIEEWKIWDSLKKGETISLNNPNLILNNKQNFGGGMVFHDVIRRINGQDQVYAKQLTYHYAKGKSKRVFLPAEASMEVFGNQFQNTYGLLSSFKNPHVNSVAQYFQQSQGKFGTLFGQQGNMAEVIIGNKAHSLNSVRDKLLRALTTTDDAFFEGVGGSKFTRTKILDQTANFTQQGTRLSTTKVGLGLGAQQASILTSRNMFFNNKQLLTFSLNQTDLFKGVDLHSLQSLGLKVVKSDKPNMKYEVHQLAQSARGNANLLYNIPSIGIAAEEQRNLLDEMGIRLGPQNSTAIAQGLVSRLPASAVLGSFVMGTGQRLDEPFQHQILSNQNYNLESYGKLGKMGVSLSRGATIEGRAGITERALKAGSIGERKLGNLMTDNTIRTALYMTPANATAGQARFLQEFSEGSVSFGLVDDLGKDINVMLGQATETVRYKELDAAGVPRRGNLVDTPSAAMGILNAHVSSGSRVARSITEQELALKKRAGAGLLTAAVGHIDGIKDSTKYAMDITTFLHTPVDIATSLSADLPIANVRKAQWYMKKQLETILQEEIAGDIPFHIRASGHKDPNALLSFVQDDITDEMVAKIDKSNLTRLQNRLAAAQQQSLKDLPKIMGLSAKQQAVLNQTDVLEQLKMYSYEQLARGEGLQYHMAKNMGENVMVPFFFRHGSWGEKSELVPEVVTNQSKPLFAGRYGQRGSMKYTAEMAATQLDFYGTSGKALAEMTMGIMRKGLKSSWLGYTLKNMFGYQTGDEIAIEALESGLKIGRIDDYRYILNKGNNRALIDELVGMGKAGKAGVDFTKYANLANMLKTSDTGYLLRMSDIHPDLEITPKGADGLPLTQSKSMAEVIMEPFSKLDEMGGAIDGDKLYMGGLNQAQLDFMQTFNSYLDQAQRGGSINVDKVREELEDKYSALVDARQSLYEKKGGAMYQLIGGVRYGFAPYHNIQSNQKILSGLMDATEGKGIGLYTMGADGPVKMRESLMTFSDTTSFGKTPEQASRTLRQAGYFQGQDVYVNLGQDALDYVDHADPEALRQAKQGFLRVGFSKHQGATRYPNITRDIMAFVNNIIFDEGVFNKFHGLKRRLGLDETLLFSGEGGTTYVDNWLNMMLRGDYDKDKWAMFGYETGTSAELKHITAAQDEFDLVRERSYQSLLSSGMSEKKAAKEAYKYASKQVFVPKLGDFVPDVGKMSEFEHHASVAQRVLADAVEGTHQTYLKSFINNTTQGDFMYKPQLQENLTTKAMAEAIQAKINQKTLSGVVNMTLRGRQAPMKQIIGNEALAKGLFTAGDSISMSAAEAEAIDLLSKYTRGGDKLGYHGIINKANAVWEAIIAQTPINKGFSSLATIRIMSEMNNPDTLRAQEMFMKMLIGKDTSMVETVSHEMQRVLQNDLNNITMDGLSPEIRKELVESFDDVEGLQSNIQKYMNKVHSADDTFMAAIRSFGGKVDPNVAVSAAAKALIRAQQLSSSKLNQVDLDYLNTFKLKYASDVGNIESALATVITDTENTTDLTINKIHKTLMGSLGLTENDVSALTKSRVRSQVNQNNATKQTPKNTKLGKESSFLNNLKRVFSNAGNYFSDDAAKAEVAKGVYGMMGDIGNSMSNNKLGWIAGGTVVGGMAVAAGMDYLGGTSPQISESPLPPNLPLDQGMGSTPSYDMSPTPSVRVAGEVPSVNSTNMEYTGGEVGAGVSMVSSLESGISGLSSTIIRDETSFFNRQSMNDYRREQDSRRF